MKLAVLILVGAVTLFGANELSNRRAPGFSLMDSHFQQHDPQDYRGKVVLIDFMQTTCPICTRLVDTLQRVKAKYGDRIAILSIMTLPDNFEKSDKFAEEHQVRWPMLFDSGQVMMSFLKMTPANPKVNFPHMFIVDGAGMIRYDFEGGEDAAEIEAMIDKAMK
ncbi:MAG TPA: TlpA disulfide reductase family protein [Bryobacteraceae bacterium]|nr:TlpA disulfide reductase family protein [Bryobacteraceae bacterium]